ncbi:hypothetical protein FACS1894107_14730 [Planctomycetales bacterium]|nr:hypothetical protein FACS1894107_14730 [Planctomycetales bacterium]
MAKTIAVSLEEENRQRAKTEKEKSAINAGLVGAAGEAVERFGSAVKEHLDAFSGIDNKTGKPIKRGLKDIAAGKVHPDYEKQNLRQQAGFSAEVKEVARENAERIIEGDSRRAVRTNDNNPLVDVIAGDGTEIQMKFVSENSREMLGKLQGKDFEKYLNANKKIGIPSERFAEIKNLIQEDLAKQRQQLEHAQAQGDSTLAASKQAKIDKLNQLDQSLRKSRLTADEALQARISPRWSTAKDIAKVSHRAGMEQAKYGAVLGGGISIVQNVVALVKGEKELRDAIFDVAKDAGSAAAVSYATGFAGSMIKGGMQNASSDTLRALSKSNLPATLAVTALECGKTFAKYFRGEIDGEECLEELGEKGVGMTSSAMFATLGQIAIPIPIVGAAIGGMVGYALSSACYKELTSALKGAKLAQEERIRIEAECEEAVKMIRAYRAEMEAVINDYLRDHIATFTNAFTEMKTALNLGDIDGFIDGANSITRKLGGKPQFNTFTEFDEFMENSISFKL